MVQLTLYAQYYIHARRHIICGDVHSCLLEHYMHATTFINIPYTRGLIKLSAFMPNTTLYAGMNIHATCYITWISTHSCVAKHYMLHDTFMVVRTLYAYPHIHGLVHIICIISHSCVTLHYMRALTFMRYLTLHTLTNIHRLVPKPGV